ncbi:hypothetical protein Y032_0764g2150 [Ancylostoma ceylanicum]|uniref:Uncharacterized protein n=1 Tax=Ancylostoma ceylanicum TaxID=53326 RepID=A0A016WD94_9BILA|nr:hypothetical protein Y032_0764g2150 [Ancylostoma ceylanicum]
MASPRAPLYTAKITLQYNFVLPYYRSMKDVEPTARFPPSFSSQLEAESSVAAICYKKENNRTCKEKKSKTLKGVCNL